MHVMVYGEFVQAPAVNLCKELLRLLPKNQETVYLTNSGTEAIEGAIKLAKKATGREELISAFNSYHGSTHGSLSLLGSKIKRWVMALLLPKIKFIRFNNENEYRKNNKKNCCCFT